MMFGKRHVTADAGTFSHSLKKPDRRPKEECRSNSVVLRVV
jgi:hypothetical protein